MKNLVISVFKLGRFVRRNPLLTTFFGGIILYFLWNYNKQYPINKLRFSTSKIETHFTEEQTKNLELQACVRQSLPCPRLELSRSENALIDLEHFEYRLNTKACVNEDTLLVVVHSAPSHFKERESIRTSWGHGSKWIKNVTVKVVFFVAAVPAEDQDLQMKLYQENRWHQDTVQGNFVDSYRNLTYKHIMALQWAVDFCPNVPYLMKMDDDIFVHYFNFVHNFIFPDPTRLQNSIECYVQTQMPVVRDKGSKWYVAYWEYPATLFSDYCSGWAYITSIAVARKLVIESRFRPYFWVDDVHVTGTLAKMAGVELVRRNPAYTTEADSLVLWSKSDNKKEWRYAFGPTWGNQELVWKGHQRALYCKRHSCECCFRVYTVVDAEDEVEVKSKSKEGKAFVQQL